jgi:hypothetical protein
MPVQMSVGDFAARWRCGSLPSGGGRGGTVGEAVLAEVAAENLPDSAG